MLLPYTLRTYTSGVASTQPMLGHSMGTVRLWEFQHKTKEQTWGVWGDAPPENFGIFELTRSVLRLFQAIPSP